MFSIEEAVKVIKQIARESGEIIMKHFYAQDFTEQTKATCADIVTQADLESDAHIREQIKKHFPQAGMITEEGKDILPQNPGKEEVWFCADPLDGTTNFSCGLPIFAVSIGILDSEHQPIGGCVYDPSRDEMFWAIKGKGAFLDAKGKTIQLHCRHKADLINCLVATGFHPDHVSNPDNNIKELSAVLPKVRCIRRCGSAALDLCYVGASRLDAYWENGPHIWDICAGWIIISEAGGVVTDYYGEPLTKQKLHENKIQLIAGSQENVTAISKLIESVRPRH
ncbi:Inositol monophosphatase family protein [Trichomonas vaginalis G3]|uniref:Inositol-1-monophosphatase n=1 Tax=Trichomonas vaginalis (strain ATCC PRA-98 / G3) TaxID=412133 RepID=A2E0Y1_TRIV3|nr:inositol-1-monophosphatase family [Trichomonas vaginalis G3]EAY13736.1 Inositol monophosphatase family protein [Trichomonas vaginalis G3]KAI5529668.1 inositol-1-monophosphatase family [Trichomonas vaginalis G3]|eukprot:XP_001325959.1 Inositol monophosphatase family protein [Trichomonas vaginalis G3]